MSDNLMDLEPAARIKALVASGAPVVIQRKRGTLEGVILGLRIAYAEVGQRYEFDGPDGNLLLDPNPGPGETNVIQGPIAGKELTEFKSAPTNVEEVDIVTYQGPQNPEVHIPTPGEVETLQAGVLTRDGVVIDPGPNAPAPAAHPLEAEPVGSKIVVTGGAAVLSTPDGIKPLPPGDVAHALPDGAKIIKTETGFRGLVDGVEGKVEVFATKIHEAIAKLLHQIRK